MGRVYNGVPPEFDVRTDGQPADLVVIQMGGNDHRPPNEISAEDYQRAYIDLIEDVHQIWPEATVLIVVRPLLQQRSACLILMNVTGTMGSFPPARIGLRPGHVL